MTGLILGSAALWAVFLRIGLRWVKVPGVTTRRVVLATVTIFLLHFVPAVWYLFFPPNSMFQYVAEALALIFAEFLLPLFVIARIFRTRWLQTIQAWLLPTLIASFATMVFVVLVFRPFLFGSYMLAANPMAPTLLGSHWLGECSGCGKSCYCSPLDDRYPQSFPRQMICDNFHTTENSKCNEKVVCKSDKIIVARFLTPRRWDLVVFKNPGQESLRQVMRVVGLPGETIRIEDGSVWVNGTRQNPPEAIRDIQYVDTMPGLDEKDAWGSPNRPAVLGVGEYYVLGDFTSSSMDSRFWDQLYPNLNSNAVPESNLKGVVTHTYWPVKRWRIHR